ncbi:DNA-processing protein DprA [Chromatium okenii]|uniref:DNA-processing protein DprA n=1 Tax=Chromatium okenii TaxID=61644 RepID=UPI0026F00E2E|nr:DNA-processing protein DprA [Chromatium okenii]MBV5309779.1 DNA-processing protein DprA [Chromatium okenii]
MTPQLSTESLAAWLALVNAPGIGPRTVAKLIEQFGEPTVIQDASAAQLAAVGLKADSIAAIKRPDAALLATVLNWLQQPGTDVLTLTDPRYPPQLADIHDAPPLLYVRGDVRLLAEPQIAIVGSRNPTPSGVEITQEFARQLVGYGLVITSGLAHGIDGAAHVGALESGRTIAVFGTGLDRVYPAAHRALARQIAENGALVSEFPPGSEPLAQNFPRRNRLISGLSLGVLVTEAALKSGSLITARTALEQGREVFAVPGSIRNPLARGCHALLRDGAKLVESAADILSELAPLLRVALTATATSAAPDEVLADGLLTLDAESRAVLKAMGFDPVAPDELIERSGFPAQQVTSILLVLELSGHVSSVPGGRYSRIRGR